MKELKILKEQVVVFSNNQSALHLCKTLVFHERTKHVILFDITLVERR